MDAHASSTTEQRPTVSAPARDKLLLTIGDYLDAYRSGAMTPATALDDVLRRIAAHGDPAIFIELRSREDLLADAAKLAESAMDGLPLYGVPVAVKDNIDVAGIPTTAACPQFSYIPREDAVAVARLKAAGAIIIGKTNLDQFATGLVGVRSPYGIPRNTIVPELVPGGSSSGSAVAVAAGLVPLALGTDTAGSGRVPAGLNNIVGLKPSLGVVSTTGVVPACRTLDCVSIFALTVDDAWIAFKAMTAPDEDDAYSREIEIGSRGAIPQLRIGVPDAASLRFGGDDAARSAFQIVCDRLPKLGFTTKPVDLTPMFETAQLLYAGPWVAERYQAIRGFIEGQEDALHPVTRAITLSAKNFNAADAFAGQYRLAALRKRAAGIWDDIDVLMVPTFPRPRTLEDLDADPIGPNSELGTYTNFVNLLDWCALAIPGTMRAEGWPAGVTFIAPAGQDARLADLGALLHAESHLKLGATARTVSAAASYITDAKPDMIELAVVGAHLSGMTLNSELLAIGAQFLRKASTTREYQLFALPGGPPYRPGLIWVGDGGHAIETEVWNLPPEQFGRFVAAIPAPLGIGTLRLADGTQVKGFLAEAYATRNADDISHYGGWRAFIAAAGK